MSGWEWSLLREAGVAVEENVILKGHFCETEIIVAAGGRTHLVAGPHLHLLRLHLPAGGAGPLLRHHFLLLLLLQLHH